VVGSFDNGPTDNVWLPHPHRPDPTHPDLERARDSADGNDYLDATRAVWNRRLLQPRRDHAIQVDRRCQEQAEEIFPR